jgi:hypothetical protein
VLVSVDPRAVDDEGLDAGPCFVADVFIWRMRFKRRGVDGARPDLREVDDGDGCGGECIGCRSIEPDRCEIDTEGFEPCSQPIAGDLDSRSTDAQSANCVAPMRQYGEMTSPASPTESPERSLAEFFADIEDGTGPSLNADDHRALVAAVRADRERSDDD